MLLQSGRRAGERAGGTVCGAESCRCSPWRISVHLQKTPLSLEGDLWWPLSFLLLLLPSSFFSPCGTDKCAGETKTQRKSIRAISWQKPLHIFDCAFSFVLSLGVVLGSRDTMGGTAIKRTIVRALSPPHLTVHRCMTVLRVEKHCRSFIISIKKQYLWQCSLVDAWTFERGGAYIPQSPQLWLGNVKLWLTLKVQDIVSVEFSSLTRPQIFKETQHFWIYTQNCPSAPPTKAASPAHCSSKLIKAGVYQVNHVFSDYMQDGSLLRA